MSSGCALLSFILNLCLPLFGLKTSYYRLFLHVVSKMVGFQLFVIDLLPALTRKKGLLLDTHTQRNILADLPAWMTWPALDKS